MFNLTCSVVLYNNDENIVREVVGSVLQSKLNVKLYLVDNSETDDLKIFANNSITEYIFNNKNIGFGRAHNIAINKALDFSEYHLVLNPDIKFSAGVLENIYNFMQANKNAGQLMPKVFYETGKLQKLCNLLPGPDNLLHRRFFQQSAWAKNLNKKYDLEGFSYDSCVNIPNLSGCFMFMRSSVLKKVGGFDERFFIYMEDVDLTRRVHRVSETLFYPNVSIYHGFKKESYSNPVLLRHHIISAIKYFNKWGWVIDKERKRINEETLKRIEAAEKNNKKYSEEKKIST